LAPTYTILVTFSLALNPKGRFQNKFTESPVGALVLPKDLIWQNMLGCISGCGVLELELHGALFLKK
jgi:hypothetical protein